MRVPEQQRLPLILNELGAGLSGNGEALQAALRRASPALQQADELVAILARQDKLLAKLTDDSDEVLGPLAEHRKDLTGFIKNAGDAGAATARQGDALEQNFAKFPAFLRELGPAADQLGAARRRDDPGDPRRWPRRRRRINEATERLGPFTKQANPALKTLGKVADQGRATFPKIEDVVSQLDALGIPLEPLAENLGGPLEELRRHGRHREPDAVHLLLHGLGQRRGRLGPLHPGGDLAHQLRDAHA